MLMKESDITYINNFLKQEITALIRYNVELKKRIAVCYRCSEYTDIGKTYFKKLNSLRTERKKVVSQINKLSVLCTRFKKNRCSLFRSNFQSIIKRISGNLNFLYAYKKMIKHQIEFSWSQSVNGSMIGKCHFRRLNADRDLLRKTNKKILHMESAIKSLKNFLKHDYLL